MSDRPFGHDAPGHREPSSRLGLRDEPANPPPGRCRVVRSDGVVDRAEVGDGALRPLVFVKPETVIGWYRRGFFRFWSPLSLRGPPTARFDDRRSHRADDSREPDVEPASHRERARQARARRRQGHGGAVHAPTQTALAPALADVGDVRPQSHPGNARHRLSHRSDGDLRRALRLLRALARAPARPARQRHRASICRVGGAADDRGGGAGRGRRARHPRSRPDLRRSVRQVARRHGTRAAPDLAPRALAERLRRAERACARAHSPAPSGARRDRSRPGSRRGGRRPTSVSRTGAPRSARAASTSRPF